MTAININSDDPMSDQKAEQISELPSELFSEQLMERQPDLQPERRKVWPFRLVAILLVVSMIFFLFAGILHLLGLPPMGLLFESGRLTRDATVRTWTESVVAISADERRGTGFVISPGQIVVTNQHIIEDADSVTVSFGAGKSETAISWDFNEEIDLVLIAVSEACNNGLVLETGKPPEPGDILTMIGNPLGFFRIVSQVEFIGIAHTGGWNEPLFAIRGAVYRGNSGSPIINAEGKVVGVLFATVASSTQEEGIIGLVIPAATILSYIDTLDAD
ncbi:MAG: S1C family serine protease [Bacillota bacterium]|nr:S1C family serine protease [Bacillota bacterium]